MSSQACVEGVGPDFRAMQKISRGTKDNMKRVLKDKWHRYSPSLLGGDLCNGSYSVFCIATQFIASDPYVVGCGQLFSLGGGILNIGVGCECLYQGWKQLKVRSVGYLCGLIWSFISRKEIEDADKKALRLLWDGFCMCSLGIIMTLMGIAWVLNQDSLDGMSSFLNGRPELVAGIWFIITIPLLLEVRRKQKVIREELNLDDVKTKMQNKKWTEIINSQRKLYGDLSLSETMRACIEEMGPRAAIVYYEMMEAVCKGKSRGALRKLALLEKKLAHWQSIQKQRLFQQYFYLLALPFALLCLIPGIAGVMCNVLGAAALVGANVLGGKMDLRDPLERNTNLTVTVPDVTKLQGEAESRRLLQDSPLIAAQT